MKILILAFLIAGPTAVAQAADINLGPVTAIKRQINDVETKCIEGLLEQDKSKPRYAFSCLIDATISPNEIVMGPNPISRLVADDCSVETNYSQGKVFIIFGRVQDSSTFAEAEACLNKALVPTHGAVELLIFKHN